MKFTGRIAKRSGAALIIALVVIQLVPISRTNPPLQTEMPATPEVRAVLRRACYDCHSNESVWPWYSRVAPVSWLLARDVNDGRRKMNFSTWNLLAAKEQIKAMRESGDDIEKGEMPPWFYLPMHPAARLSATDRSILLAWSRAASGGNPAER